MTELRVINGGASLPQSAEAEQCVLGTLLLAPERIPEAVSRGGVALFLDPLHAEIFRVIAERDRAGQLVSPVTLAGVASLKEGLSQVGGPGYLARLAGVASSAGLQSMLDLLEDLRARRDLLAIVRKAEADLSDGADTPAEVAARIEAATAALGATSTAVRPVSITAATTKALEEVDKAFRGEVPTLVPSGIRALDAMIQGFKPGDLALLGGRPSMGKTGLALSIALNAARAGHGVIFASLEMTPDSIALRAMSEGTGGMAGNATAFASAARGDMTPDQYRALADSARALVELPIHFLPRKYAEPDALFSGVKQTLRALPPGKLPLVIVDYLQLMRVPGANRFEIITAISQGLKDTAMRLEVPVLALSQLSRAVEQRDNKRPVLSDLRESGQLEQDADQIMFCYRDEYYVSKEEPDPSSIDHEAWRGAMDRARNQLEIIVAKQRQGATGTARVRFNPAINLVWEDRRDE